MSTPPTTQRRLVVCLTMLAAVAFSQSALLAEEVSTESATAKKPVKVAVYCHSGGNSKGAKNLTRFLTAENGFEMTVVSPEQIQEGVLADGYDVVVMPGGMASSQAKHLDEKGKDEVRKFVQGGGGYVGICAGAYLSTTYRDWSLGIVNARVWDHPHWARGTGIVSLKMTSSGCSVLQMPEESVDVYYGQGPMLAPGNDPNLPGYEVLASYGTEVAKKGAPEGAMVGMHAIIRTMYGTGRVVAFSPHPEKKTGPESLMAAGIRWAGRGE